MRLRELPIIFDLCNEILFHSFYLHTIYTNTLPNYCRNHALAILISPNIHNGILLKLVRPKKLHFGVISQVGSPPHFESIFRLADFNQIYRFVKVTLAAKQSPKPAWEWEMPERFDQGLATLDKPTLGIIPVTLVCLLGLPLLPLFPLPGVDRPEPVDHDVSQLLHAELVPPAPVPPRHGVVEHLRPRLG